MSQPIYFSISTFILFSILIFFSIMTFFILIYYSSFCFLFLSSGLGASRIGCLGLSVCRSVCQKNVKKLSKSLKQKNFNIELKAKYISKVGQAHIYFQTLFCYYVCLSVCQKCQTVVKQAQESLAAAMSLISIVTS